MPDQPSTPAFEPRPTGEEYGFVTSLQFQFLVAMVVLLASFVPTLMANYRRAREAQAEEERRVEVSASRQAKKEEKKKRRGGGSSNGSTAQRRSSVEDDQDAREAAEREAAATVEAAEREAAELRRRAQEEADAMVREAQKQTAAEMQRKAELEAESLRRRTEEELAALKKQVADEAEMLSQQKSQEELVLKRVQEAAEAARRQMAEELENYKKEARKEVEEAKEEAARIRKEAEEQRNSSAKGGRNMSQRGSPHPPKPPRLQTERTSREEPSPRSNNQIASGRAITPPASSPHASRSRDNSPHQSPRHSPNSPGGTSVAAGPGLLFGAFDDSQSNQSRGVWGGGWRPTGDAQPQTSRYHSAPTTRAASPSGSSPTHSPQGPGVMMPPPSGVITSPPSPATAASAEERLISEARAAAEAKAANERMAQAQAQMVRMSEPPPAVLPAPAVPTSASATPPVATATVARAQEPSHSPTRGSPRSSPKLGPSRSPSQSASPSAATPVSIATVSSGGTEGRGAAEPPDPTQLVPYKMKLCHKFMQTGMCKRGSACTYAHGEEEIGMERPRELQGVTLGEMNARKRGKNMVNVPANHEAQPAQHHFPNSNFNDAGGIRHGHGGLPPEQWDVASDGNRGGGRRSRRDRGGNARRGSWEQPMMQESTWGPEGGVAMDPWSSAPMKMPTAPAEEAAKAKSVPGKSPPRELSVEIPPKPPTKRTDGVVRNASAPPAHENAFLPLKDLESEVHPSEAKETKKEPSPFLPLSPAMDHAFWADEPTPDTLRPFDGGFSWADQASSQFKEGLARGQR